LGMPRSITGVFQGLLLFALLACDTLINYRIVRSTPAALRATPSRGHSLQPGRAGSAAVLEAGSAGQPVSEEKR
jgi:hypothetical protein